MANKFPGQPCVFCGDPNFGVGEHVWSRWFLGDMAAHGLFTISKNGKPYLKKDGTAQTWSTPSGVNVPACEACNNALDASIEKGAKPVVRRIVAHGDSTGSLVLSTDECTALARWLLKVALLSALEVAEHAHPGLRDEKDLPTLSTVRPEWLAWMPTADPPPDGFSVYITRRALDGADPVPASSRTIVIPNVTVDGADQDYMTRVFGFFGVHVTVIWHPHWPIVHSQVDEGRAARLWPDPVAVDFGALPQVSPNELKFWNGAVGSIGVASDQLDLLGQHPLSVDADAFTLFFGGDLGVDERSPGTHGSVG
jgi:hypothetical protein